VGKLEILANNNIKKLDFVIVPVKIGTAKNNTGKLIKGEKEELINSLKQFYIDANIEEIKDAFKFLYKDNKEAFFPNGKIINGNINHYIEPKFDKKYPQYKNHIKIFLFSNGAKLKGTDIVGIARYLGAKSVALFGTRKLDYKIISHEVLHALSLRHVFDNDAKYQFTKGSTKNIMDYGKKLYFTSSYQWQRVQQYIKVQDL